LLIGALSILATLVDPTAEVLQHSRNRLESGQSVAFLTKSIDLDVPVLDFIETGLKLNRHAFLSAPVYPGSGA
jgi:hypothetical protein